MTYFTNVDSMLGHRLRRRPNIKSTYVQCIVWLGYNVTAEINKLGLLLHDGREMKSI